MVFHKLNLCKYEYSPGNLVPKALHGHALPNPGLSAAATHERIQQQPQDGNPGAACGILPESQQRRFSRIQSHLKENPMSDLWLSTLKTATPQEGYELAIKLSRMGIKYTQPSDEVRQKLRDDYANNADSLTAVSQVVATNFQTVAAANNYWNERP